MEPQEIRAELIALAAEIGPKAYLSVSVSVGEYCGPTVTGAVYPNGMGVGTVSLHTHKSESWADAVAEMRAAWEAHRDLHASNTTKGMALAIIRLTAENGECTDGALRCEFNQQDIDRYGDAAATLATEMGGNGPFEIVRLGVGNMPEAA